MSTTPSQVLLGEHDYKTSGETASLRMNVVQIKNHPNYDDLTTDYDFAMLKLKSSVNFCNYEHIRPVCLPSNTNLNYAMETATTTGWGTTSSGGSLSSKLREVNVKVLTNSQCKNDYGYSSSMITSEMLCANVEGGGQDSCQVFISRLTLLNDKTFTVLGRLWWPSDHCRVKQQLSADRSRVLGDRLCPGQLPWGVCQVRNQFFLFLKTITFIVSRVTSELTWINNFLSQGGQFCPAS